jgi:hypothetical protein
MTSIISSGQLAPPLSLWKTSQQFDAKFKKALSQFVWAEDDPATAAADLAVMPGLWPLAYVAHA